jgi:hypothetical protein
MRAPETFLEAKVAPAALGVLPGPAGREAIIGQSHRVKD